MGDENKTREQLISELAELRHRVREVEALEAQRKGAEKALDKSEEPYRHLFEQCPIGIGIASLDGRVVSANRVMESITGYSTKELKKINLIDTYENVEDRKALLQAMSQYGSVVDFPVRLKRKDGTPYHALLSISQVNLGGKDFLHTICQDITERRRAEEELLLHSEIMRNMVEGVILTRVSDGTIVYANPKFQEMFGYAHGEPVGKNISVVNAPTEKSPEEIAKDIQRSLNKTGVWSGEVHNIRRDSTSFWCYANVSTFEHPEYGKVWVAVHTDITERKQRDEQLRTSLKEKEELLSEVHHRVKNNLQVISSLLDMSSMRTKDQRAIDLLADARAKIHTMALIHSQLYRSERFDQIKMASHIEELVSYLAGLYPEAQRISTVIEVPEIYLPITQALPCALVLNELISNAFKHAFKKRQTGTVKISMQRSDKDMILMKVKDDGIGLPNEIDIHKTDTLGLKLVRNLVEKQLNGKIQVKRDEGTEFIIEFKILERAEYG